MRSAHDATELFDRSRPAIAGPGLWERGLLVVALLMVLLFATARAADDDDKEEEAEPPLPKESAELARKYAAINAWQGFFESSESGSVSWSGSLSHGTEAIENTSHGQFLLKRSPDWSGEDVRQGVLTWSGGDNKTVCGEQIVASDVQHSAWDKLGRGDEWRRQAGGTLPMTATEFTLWLPTAKKKSYLVHVHPGGPLSGKTLTSTTTGRRVWDESKGNGTDVRRTMSLDATEQLESFGYWYSPVGDAATAPWFQVVRGGPGVLVFPFESITRADTQASTPELTRRSRVILFPVYDDVEVEVTIEGYAKWRPEGSIDDPKKPGNGLVVHAVLKSKKGKTKDLPEVKRFKFELLDTSREPGVCLNWPLNAKDQDYDLRLAPVTAGTLGKADQKLEVTAPPRDDDGQPYAEARINSYDFGGRASLLTVCELVGGREIMGLMKGEGGGQGVVLLPRRFSGDWIAKQWRDENHVVELSASDDAEQTEGNDHDGDGFTLYEEYRGFAVRGHHVEGDPMKKDFCILNLVGSDAWAGIHMFEAATGLRAIHRLLPTEMAQDDRLMNGNHRDGPHRVDQHGVWIKAFGAGELEGHGAATVAVKGGLTGRPGNTAGIGVPFKADESSDFNRPWNLPPDDQAIAYDRAVAHELAHSVGAMHHGNTDRGAVLRYLPADDPRNPLGRPAIFAGRNAERGPILVLREKKPNEDFLVREAPIRERQLQALRAGLPDYASLDAPTRAAIVDLLNLYQWYGGMPRGQCSGNEQCLMRYYFANVYPNHKDEQVLYFVELRSENVGVILCSSPEGTGVNDARTHEPQSRYFDANTDLRCGNCRAQICPNDAIPPGPRANGL